MTDQQQTSIDWEKFRTYMMGQFPFLTNHKMINHDFMNADLIDDYAQKAMKRIRTLTNHPFLHPFIAKEIDYELFETHQSIFVQIRLPEKISLRDVKIAVNRRTLKVEFQKKAEIITLPADVDSLRSNSKFKNGLLEIRMPKTNENEPYHPISVK
jgi:HSP20 family molecular chaperone IbpA